MLRSDLNMKLSGMARSLSPRKEERGWASRIYNALDDALSNYDCSKIGSFPRYTAITPIHDLDILCTIGVWEGPKNPKKELATLARTLNSDKNLFKALPEIRAIQVQTHSVCIEFESETYPSVDLIPCYSSSKVNEFGDPLYYVPEVIRREKKRREEYSIDLNDIDSWILSDPKGYISLAKEANNRNECFRKTTKIVKYWKKTLCNNTNIKLKSFHLEQIVMRVTSDTKDMTESIVEVFRAIPSAIQKANQIPDRAQRNTYIDDYVASLTEPQKERIVASVKNCLSRLEKIDDKSTIEDIFMDAEAVFSVDEKLITYDYGFMPCFDEANQSAKILCTGYENRAMRSKIDEEKLYFKLANSFRTGLRYYWKVKNSRSLPKEQWRGEINEGRTKNYPERKAYKGIHSVECYAVNADGECVSYDKYDVELL